MVKGFLSLSRARDYASLAPATPTQAVGEGERNREKQANASARRARHARREGRENTFFSHFFAARLFVELNHIYIRACDKLTFFSKYARAYWRTGSYVPVKSSENGTMFVNY